MLSKHTEQLARNLGAKVLRSDCTSAYSTKVLHGFGWKTALEILYKDYVDEHGNVLIHTEPPHDRYTLKYKVLD